MTTHKTTAKTLTGEITTWIVSDPNCMTFRVSTFKMDADYAKKSNYGKQIYDMQVEAFDRDTFEWKSIIKTNDFSNEEIKAMIDGDEVLGKLKDFLKSFFGIRLYFDEKEDSQDGELPF